MQGFSNEGGPPNISGSRFSKVGQNFTIEHRNEIKGNFPKKIVLKLLELLKVIGKISEK